VVPVVGKKILSLGSPFSSVKMLFFIPMVAGRCVKDTILKESF